jgi:4-hydroxy-2-oxoglutarate aldolase
LTKTTPDLGGIIAAIPTPFDANEELALDALASDITRWNATRLDGYTVLGTTGEFVSLTTDEKKRVIERARSAIPANKTMLAGTGEESTRATVALSRWAGEIGCDYAIVVTPHYARMMFSRDSLRQHYDRVADASPIPIVIYHIPQCTGVDLSPQTVAEIAEHDNVAGIKDSSGNVFALQEMRRLCPADFVILTGGAHVLHAALSVGADGAILAEACSAPELCVELRDAFEAGDLARARALQERLANFNRILIGKYGISGVKALLETQGFSGGPTRSPLTPLSREAVAELVAALELATEEPIAS